LSASSFAWPCLEARAPSPGERLDQRVELRARTLTKLEAWLYSALIDDVGCSSLAVALENAGMADF